MGDSKATTSSSMYSPTDGYNKYTSCISLTLSLSHSVQDNEQQLQNKHSKLFCPSYIYIYNFRDNYKYSLNKRTRAYLLICPYFWLTCNLIV